MSAKGFSRRSAALLTRISIRPKCFAAASVIASTALASATSPIWTCALPPKASISRATASASARLLRALTRIDAPPSASASAIARPILRPAPVTMATLPLSSFIPALYRSLASQRAQIDTAVVESRQQPQGRIALRFGPAAMPGVEREFIGHILPGQRLLRAAAHVRLPLLDHAAVLHGRPDMAGIVVWIGILRVDHKLHLGRQREHLAVGDRRFRECAEPDPAMDKTGREQIGRGEFCGIA